MNIEYTTEKEVYKRGYTGIVFISRLGFRSVS